MSTRLLSLWVLSLGGEALDFGGTQFSDSSFISRLHLQRQLFGVSFGTPSATAQALFSDGTATSATCFEPQRQ
jgi:hypothetical protein